MLRGSRSFQSLSINPFMFGKRPELQVPDAARKDSNAVEILRIWIAGGSQHVSLKSGVWEDPGGLGTDARRFSQACG